MGIEKDQKYLRVRNTSDQDLYLADLDDEENKSENKTIQVYIPAGEHADLPMDDEVIHSYEKGTIRGFIKQGLLSASPFGEQRANTLWVGPDGSDDNPGTYSSPLSSIQKAIEQLDDQFSLYEWKRVGLKIGTYTENIYINTQNLHIFGESGNAGYFQGEGVKIEPENEDRPIIGVSNMSKDGWEDYWSDGGASFTWNLPYDYSYTGASLKNRDLRSDLTYISLGSRITYKMKVKLEGFTIFGSSMNSLGYTFICAPNDSVSETEAALSRTKLQGVYFYNQGLFKNMDRLLIHSSKLLNKKVVDNVSSFKVKRIGDTTIFSEEALSLGDNDNPVLLYGDRSQTNGDEGGIGTNSALDGDGLGVQETVPDTYVSGTFRVEAGVTDRNRYPIDANKFRGNTDIRFGAPVSRLDVACESFEWDGSGDVYASTIRTKTFDWTGSGALDAYELLTTQDATISNGTGHVIKGGTVDGNLTVNGGAGVELRGVTVKGDLIVDQDNTSVTLEGCHVEGTLDVDSGNDNSGVSVTVSGGSIMNANDPGSNITTESAFYG